MKLKLLSLLSIFSVLWALTSCSNDEPEAPVYPAKKTILVYMAANNSLGSYGCDYDDLNEMKTAAMNGCLGKGNRLLIFHAPRSGSKTLYEMTPEGQLVELMNYDEDTSYVIESSFMLKVFEDAKTAAPAPEYGLIMWSHSLGWTQDGYIDDAADFKPKTWGDDRGRNMNITALKSVLEASPWDWIYFDCCFMGTAEVAYELAPVVDTIVASATEVPLDGMPYDKNLPLLFMDTPDFEGAAQNTFEYYDRLNGSSRTCTISVFDLTKMDALAKATRRIYQASQTVSLNDFPNLRLDVLSTTLFYDYGVYVEGLCRTNPINKSDYDAWKRAYDAVVVYTAATPMLWSTIDLSAFSGMSTYVFRDKSQTSFKNYDTLSWYTDVAHYLFDE